MQPNPIIAREARVRWRSRTAFVILLAYALLLALPMGWTYYESVRDNTDVHGQALGQMAQLGHELFSVLTFMQVVGWMLLAPPLTSAAIAGERERGLLEGLQLSRLTPGQIVRGKLFAALAFMLLLLLAGLPATALCFLLGGVSPGEFRGALLLQLLTATSCGSIGLCCSAWSRRSGTALSSAIGLVILWLISSGIALWATLISRIGGATGAGWSSLIVCCDIYSKTNPIYAASMLLDPVSTRAALLPWDLNPWVFNLLFQIVLTLALLGLSARALRRPFPEAHWVESHALRPVISEVVTAPVTAPVAGEAPAVSTPTPMPTPARKTARSPGVAERRDLLLASWVRCANPILQRELRARLRVRRAGTWRTIFNGLALLILGLGYGGLLWKVLTDTDWREGVWWTFAFIGLGLTMLTSALAGAGAFTREREAGTWQGIRLSLLAPLDIIAGKLGAALLWWLATGLIFWPLMLPCIRSVTYAPTVNGVSLTRAGATALVLAATAWSYTLWGMMFSWRFKRTSVAVGWTLGSLFLLLVFGPIFFNFLGEPWGTSLVARGFSGHPFIALGILMDSKPTPALLSGVISALLIGLPGGIVLLLLLTAMSGERRDDD